MIIAASLLRLKNHQIGYESFHVLNRVDVDSYCRSVCTSRKPQPNQTWGGARGASIGIIVLRVVVVKATGLKAQKATRFFRVYFCPDAIGGVWLQTQNVLLNVARANGLISWQFYG